ncbi:MAG: clostripain-related cysteine peptidase [Muribaculaceae bacterium]|nr:clostripain-related cysteine peptidase [Muribaculaceae bacterium]
MVDKQKTISSVDSPIVAQATLTEEERENPTDKQSQSEKQNPAPLGSEKLITLLTWIFRLAIGGTFIFSGVVKAIDPWGTIYKLHDYIAAMPQGFMGWALPLLTPFAFALFTIEILLGISVITGSYRRLSAIGSLLMMLVMTPLTLWIALKNPVPDCGCFGDALILTNWQTFWKNIVLLAMSVWLLIYNRHARCLILPGIQWLMVIGTLVFAVFIGFVGYSIQPMIDFRPYPIGSNLIDAATDEGETGSDTLMAIWQRGDEQITIPADSIPQGEGWEFIDRVENTNNKVSDSDTATKSKGLAIFDDAEDITEDVIPSEGEAVVVFMYDLPNLSKGNYYKLNSLYAYCKQNDIALVVVAAATPLQINDFIDQSLAEYPVYTAEDTAMKEVARGNPSFVYLKDGKIVYKAVFSAIPTYDFKEDTPARPGALADYAPKWADSETLNATCLIMLSFIVLLIFASHVPRVVNYTARRIRKSRWVKAGDVVKLMGVVLISAALTSCSDDDPKPDDTNPDKERTILIYMVATNTLNNDSRDDINEILSGYNEYSDIVDTEILIYRTSLSQEVPTLYRVEQDKTGSAALQPIKEYDESVSSVSEYRMGEVIHDMKRLAPADEYGLFLWSHATSWLPDGVNANAPSRDDAPVYYSYGDDYGKKMRITDLAEAIPQGLFSFIWFDCCLMSNIEVVYQLRNHCPTIVAYPTEVLSGGAPYNLIFPYIATTEFSLDKAVKTMFDYYAESSSSSQRNCTIALIDTSDLPQVAAQAHDIVSLGYKLQSTSGLMTYGRLSGTYFYDLGQVFTTLAGSDQVAANSFMQWVDRVVTHKYATPKFLNYTIYPEHFSGLSCHIPGTSTNTLYEQYYKTLDWYKAVYE